MSDEATHWAAQACRLADQTLALERENARLRSEVERLRRIEEAARKVWVARDMGWDLSRTLGRLFAALAAPSKEGPHSFDVSCENPIHCQVKVCTDEFRTRDEAIEAWNRRTPTQEAPRDE